MTAAPPPSDSNRMEAPALASSELVLIVDAGGPGDAAAARMLARRVRGIDVDCEVAPRASGAARLPARRARGEGLSGGLLGALAALEAPTSPARLPELAAAPRASAAARVQARRPRGVVIAGGVQAAHAALEAATSAAGVPTLAAPRGDDGAGGVSDDELRRFLFDRCGCSGTWTMETFVEQA